MEAEFKSQLRIFQPTCRHNHGPLKEIHGIIREMDMMEGIHTAVLMGLY